MISKVFLQKGTVFDFDVKTKEQDIIALLGMPDEIEDYGKNGKYLHYNNVRFSIYNNYFTGTTISLYHVDFSVEELVGEYCFSINKNFDLIDMLHFLNKLSIKWDISHKKSALDYCVIETSSRISIYYNYEDRKLMKMSRNIPPPIE